MGWAADAYEALKKVILIEDRMTKIVEELKKMSDLYSDLNTRLVKMETKLEIYEGLARTTRERKQLKSSD